MNPTPFRPCVLALIGLASLLASVTAQNKQTIIPKKYAGGGTARTLVPFSEQPLHYQQTFSAAVMKEQLSEPVRLRGISFKSKGTGDASMQIEVQLSISSFSGGPLNAVFSRNMKADTVTVVPKRFVTLPVSTGGFDLALPFAQDWIWDGESAIILDIQIYSNGNQSRQFFYWWDSIAPDLQGGVNAQYALGANSTIANVPLSNQGLMAQFDYQKGLTMNYGAGCKGQGGFVPKIGASSLPTVGNPNFRINVSSARPQTFGILMWGSSDKNWGPVTLPFALVNIGIPNCTLLAEPLDLVAAQITGGSPGSGIGSLPFPIPPSSLLIGYNLYMQWAVIDDTNNAALDLVFSDAMRVIIG
ncbi:MAG: hypothetical protein H6832_00415 [Planctomycetes bacterium]|nr:hypothetical protein [Planctomycetota bacterium]MCB9916845.1 hypothetical protein [Planctomycetota bacterium]